MRFYPDIASEVKASFVWYQEKSNGLGDDFLYELESAYQEINELPRTNMAIVSKWASKILAIKISLFGDLSRI